MRNITVFIASPGDLAVERRAFRTCIDELNSGFGDGAKVTFEPLGWEDTLASTGRRSQGVINAEIDRCDVFVLAMHRRWGQEAPDAKPYSSYTEEEFHRAARLITAGPYARQHWLGSVALGIAVPLVLLLLGVYAPAGVLVLVGLWIEKSVFVRAGQALPIS